MTFRQFVSTPADPAGILDLYDLYHGRSETEQGQMINFTMELPDLDQGSGVLIPIFTQVRFWVAPGDLPSEAIIGKYLVPQTIEYYDNVEERTYKIEVRKMLDSAIYFKAGVSSRG